MQSKGGRDGIFHWHCAVQEAVPGLSLDLSDRQSFGHGLAVAIAKCILHKAEIIVNKETNTNTKVLIFVFLLFVNGTIS